MLDFFLDLLGFFLKLLMVVFVVAAPLMLTALMRRRGLAAARDKDGFKIVIKDLREVMKKRRSKMDEALKNHNPDKAVEDLKPKPKKFPFKKESRKPCDDFKTESKKRQDFVKSLEEKEQQGIFCPKNLYILNFKGGARGSEVRKLRREIDAILDVATPKDEVVVRLTSAGGMVNGYGLLASQLVRVRDRGIHLVCAVDSVAASGGYLMAAVANRIVAAPFAYIGSIGVVAAMPNFRRFLDEHHVDYEQITAGRYKRTLTMFGRNSQEGRDKFKEELEAIHQRFKDQVLKYRPEVDIEKVATGEHWLGIDAMELGLVDEIATSDEYILKRAGETYNCVLQISCTKKHGSSLLSRLFKLLGLKKSRGQFVRSIVTNLEDNAYRHIK